MNLEGSLWSRLLSNLGSSLGDLYVGGWNGDVSSGNVASGSEGDGWSLDLEGDLRSLSLLGGNSLSLGGVLGR